MEYAVFSFILMDEYLIFNCALAVALAFAALEIFGMLVGFSFLTDSHTDHDIDISGDGLFASINTGLKWMGFGKVPLIAHLILLAGLFGLIGILMLHFVYSFTGLYLSNWASVPLVLIATVILSNRFTALVVKIIPTDETNAILIVDLVGSEAVITIGKATHTMSAPANTMDKHGTLHNFLVRAIAPDMEIQERTKIRLVSYESAGYFYVQPLN